MGYVTILLLAHHMYVIDTTPRITVISNSCCVLWNTVNHLKLGKDEIVIYNTADATLYTKGVKVT